MKKIMFNDKYGLTKAVLEGRKTMTRSLPGKEWKDIMPGLVGQDLSKANTPFKVGDVVAVAQKYSEIEIPISGETRIYNEGLDLYQSKLEYEPGWTNKMFVKANLMPHQIRITNVRVERMQDISDEDCIREGIYEVPFWDYSWEDNGAYFGTPREAFAALIDKVSGKGIWNRNPWVFVYEFELVK